MDPYPKIPTVYERDPENNYKTLIEGKFATPELAYLVSNLWVFTEKIDGTNIRVIWDGSAVEFRGRTDRAQIPPFLLKKLKELSVSIPMHYPDVPMTLYGEGYGNKIQKVGKHYIPDGVDFILFDVRIGDLWLERENVSDIALTLGISEVPVVGTGTLFDAIDMVGGGFQSRITTKSLIAEGLVMRPEVELFDRRGQRIITKIKRRDFDD